MVEKAQAHLVLSGLCGREEMVRELNQFSHLWIIFLFHQTVKEGWKAMVRPPGLGGQHRVGVFASRSPHRPNHIGLSAVRLVNISVDDNRVTLELGGGDFLDKTPVLDIKPYIAYSDSIEQSTGGYSGNINSTIRVRFSKEAEKFCNDYRRNSKRDLQGLISQVLAQDPRPASQRDKKTDFGMRLWDVNVRWRVAENIFTVVWCRKY